MSFASYQLPSFFDLVPSLVLFQDGIIMRIESLLRSHAWTGFLPTEGRRTRQVDLVFLQTLPDEKLSANRKSLERSIRRGICRGQSLHAEETSKPQFRPTRQKVGRLHLCRVLNDSNGTVQGYPSGLVDRDSGLVLIGINLVDCQFYLRTRFKQLHKTCHVLR